MTATARVSHFRCKPARHPHSGNNCCVMSITLRRRLRPYRAQSTDGKESSHGDADTGHQAVLRSLQKDLFGRRVQRFRSVTSALIPGTSSPGLLLLPRSLHRRARGSGPDLRATQQKGGSIRYPDFCEFTCLTFDQPCLQSSST